MNSQSVSNIFKILRAVEILIVFICFILEIVEYAAFQIFYIDQGFNGSAYFNADINKSMKDDNVVYYNGTKIFFYIVLIITLADSGFYLSRFCRFYMGPYKRDISINAFFMTLWLTSGIANIYPSFKGYGYTCDNLPVIGEDTNLTDAVAREFQIDEPEQVMIYKTYSKKEMKRGTPIYIIKTSQNPI
ncbi:21074_t:CDS:2 [Rhizophagus irregularis]|nr:21074_t:CDS:2 [Rhizophagus irregularis]